MRDFLPLDVARRRYVTSVVQEVYESYGFVPLETPSIENLSTLLGKYGDEGDQLLYRLLHRRDKLARAVEAAHGEGRPVAEGELADQGLRYDLTVPLARVVAQYRDLPRFFKRYQIQPVWRADRPGKGRYREFFQCDVDVVGTSSLLAEAELCAAVATVLERLGFSDFRINLNHRELLRGMIASVGIDAKLEASALVAVDKLDKIGRDKVAEELEQRGIDSAAAGALLDVIIAKPGADDTEVLTRVEEALTDPRGLEAIVELRELLDCMTDSPAAKYLNVDPALARGLSYYTGPIFEVRVDDLAGSLAGGGRYDELVGMFGKRTVPAVGFSLGLERILVVMEERGLYPELSVGPEVMLCWMGVERRDVLRVASTLRKQGLRVEVFPEPAKLGKQLQYADSDGVKAPFAAIVGDGELAADEITIKRLASGEQRRVSLSQAATTIAAMDDTATASE
jgi:histidyl-tRNA synthetase